MVAVSVKFFGIALNRYTALLLLLTRIHVKGECERAFTRLVCFFLKFGHFSLVDTAEFEKKVTRRCGLTCIDMTRHYNGKVLFVVCHGRCGR
mmetsp:Transcript_5276/g.15663  ORF Transcript_5276/g.15663 Transcript_5276/m.15663 type:complete len:92 (+) Transcript_5276:1289-1564(+)